MVIDFEQGDDFVKMNQRRYLTKVLERFDISDCNPGSTPSEQKLICIDELADCRRYREAVGSVMPGSLLAIKLDRFPGIVSQSSLCSIVRVTPVHPWLLRHMYHSRRQKFFCRRTARVKHGSSPATKS